MRADLAFELRRACLLEMTQLLKLLRVQQKQVLMFVPQQNELSLSLVELCLQLKLKLGQLRLQELALFVELLVVFIDASFVLLS